MCKRGLLEFLEKNLSEERLNFNKFFNDVSTVVERGISWCKACALTTVQTIEHACFVHKVSNNEPAPPSYHKWINLENFNLKKSGFRKFYFDYYVSFFSVKISCVSQ